MITRISLDMYWRFLAGCRWFARGGGRRERTVLATELYGDMCEWPNDGKLSALNIRRALDASLTRLQTGYIDLCQFHHVDRATPWDEIWQAIDAAVTAGKILYVGSSNFAGWHIAEAQEATRGSGAGRTLRGAGHKVRPARSRWRRVSMVSPHTSAA